MDNAHKALAVAAMLVMIVSCTAILVSDQSAAVENNESGNFGPGDVFSWTYIAADKKLVFEYKPTGGTGDMPSQGSDSDGDGDWIGDGDWMNLAEFVEKVEFKHISGIGSCLLTGFTALTSVTTDTPITSIGGSAFYGCTSLDPSNLIADGLTSIGANAFEGTAMSGFITIPGSVTKIGKSAFQNTDISGVTFEANESGEQLTIKDKAFADCTDLETVVFEGEAVPEIGDDAFKTGPKFSVPEGSESKYGSALAGSAGDADPSINGYVATINGTPYGSLDKAIEAANSGDIIVLKVDVELDRMLDIKKSGITIDLERHTITASTSFWTSYPNDSHLINIASENGQTVANVTIEDGEIDTTSVNKHAINVYGCSGIVLKDLVLDSTDSTKSGIPLQINGSEVTLGGNMTFTGSTVLLKNAINMGDSAPGSTEVVLKTMENTTLHFTDCSYGYQVDVSNATAKVQFGAGTSYDYNGDSFALAFPYGDEAEVTGSADDLNKPNVTFNVTPSNATVTISQNGEEVEVTTGDGTVELVAGTYDVEYSLAGYVTYNTTVTVDTDNVDVPAYTMKTPEPEPETHSVDFYVQGTLYKHLDIPDGEAIPEDDVPTDPVVEGYMFAGWECNGMTWTWSNGAVTEDMRIDAVLYEMVNIGINVTGDAYIGETVTLTPDFDDSAYDVITVAWGYGTTSDISDSKDYGVGESVTATQSGYYFVIVFYTDGTDMFYAMGSTHLEFVENPSHGGGDDNPYYPPIIPGGDDDDVVIPPTVVVDQGSSDDDEAVKIVACAACAVVAAFLAAVMLFHRRD